MNAAEHVAALLEGGTENHSTGREATRSLEIIEAFDISHYTGSQISIPLREIEITSW